MKTKLLLFASFLSTTLPIFSAYADHWDDEPGSSLSVESQLATEASQLNTEVQYSYINYGVKNLVSSFASAASQLSSCKQYYVSTCGGERQQVENTFRQVKQYLSDTYNDFPSIYREYQRVEALVNALYTGGGNYPPSPYPTYPPSPYPPSPYQPSPYPTYPPSPYPSNPYQPSLSAVGNMDSTSFNFYGTRSDIQSQCIRLGDTYRISYVRNLQVNGVQVRSPSGQVMLLSQACVYIAQYSR